MATDVVVTRSFANPDYWGGDNSLVYPFKGAGTGGSQMEWIGNTPNAVGTFGGPTSIIAEDNLTFDGDDLFIGPLTSPKIAASVHSVVIGDVVSVGDYGGIEFIGNQTSTGQRIGAMTFHNQASGAADKRVVDVFVTRCGANNSADFTIEIANTSAVMKSSYYAARNEQKWYTDGDLKVTLALTSLYPGTDGTIELGSVLARWGTFYATDAKIIGSGNHIMRIDGSDTPIELQNVADNNMRFTWTGEMFRLDFSTDGAAWTGYESAITAHKDGGVILRHNNSTKLETIATGVIVTGTVRVSDLSGVGSRVVTADASGNLGAGNLTGQVTTTNSLTTSLHVTAISEQTALGSGLISTDELLVNDGGVIKRMDVSVLETYMESYLAFNDYTHPNHTGHVTSAGDGAQTLVVAAITGQTAGGTIAHTDEFVYSDGGVIKRIDASIIADYVEDEMPLVSSAAPGFAPAHAGVGNTYFLNANCTWSIPTGAHGNHTGHVTSVGLATTLTVSAITGQTALTSGLASTDELLVSDGGVIKRMDVSVIKTYVAPDYGADNQIPFMNSTTDFDYSANLTWNGTKLTIGGDISVAATKKVYLDGGGDTYIYESIADGAHIVVGGGLLTTWQAGQIIIYQLFKPNANKTIDLGTSSDEFFDNAYVDRLYIDDTATYLDINSGDLTLTDTNTGTKTLEELAMGNFGVVTGALVFSTSRVNINIISLPINAVIWDIQVHVATIFNDTGMNQIRIGISTDDDRYELSSSVLTGTGWRTLSLSNVPDKMSGTTQITAQYFDGDQNASAGAATVYVQYSLH